MQWLTARSWNLPTPIPHLFITLEYVFLTYTSLLNCRKRCNRHPHTSLRQTTDYIHLHSHLVLAQRRQEVRQKEIKHIKYAELQSSCLSEGVAYVCSATLDILFLLHSENPIKETDRRLKPHHSENSAEHGLPWIPVFLCRWLGIRSLVLNMLDKCSNMDLHPISALLS